MAEVPFKKDLPEPSMKDLLDLHRKQIFLDFNCHVLATVQSFDENKQTCTATVNYKKTVFDRDPGGNYVPKLIDYPVLLDIPVIQLTGGKAGVRFPITAGDTCVVLFNDRDMDNWFSSGQVMQLNSNRMHSLSDGLALVGVRSLANPVAGYNDRAAIYNDEAMVEVAAQKVKIANAITTLNTLLQDLITQINLITVTTGGVTSTVPNNAAAFTALAAQIAGLLE